MTESMELAKSAIHSLLVEEASDETFTQKMIGVIQGLETAETRFQLASEVLLLFNPRLNKNELVLGPLREIALQNVTGTATQCVDKLITIYRSCRIGSDASKKVIDASLDLLKEMPLEESVHASRLFVSNIGRLYDHADDNELEKVAPNILKAFSFAADRVEKIEDPELASKAARRLLGEKGWLYFCDSNDRRQQMARLNLLVRDEDKPSSASQTPAALHRPSLDTL